MKRILLPTDFSENATKAINYARYLFEKEECTFYVLHVYQVSPSNLSSTINKAKDTRLFRAAEDQAKSEMDRLFKKIVDENENELHVFEKLLYAEPLINAVGRTVIDRNVDYIFMGTKGSSALKEIFIGSNTLSIIRDIEFCPVVAVPEVYDYDIPDEILFPTDFTRSFEAVQVKPLREMASLWQSKIRVLHISEYLSLNEGQQKNKAVLEKLMEGIELNMEYLDKHGSISSAINHYSQNPSIGMVALVNTLHSFVENLFREKIVERVAFKVEKPLLIIPEIS